LENLTDQKLRSFNDGECNVLGTAQDFWAQTGQSLGGVDLLLTLDVNNVLR
jgi:hypothetical protein